MLSNINIGTFKGISLRLHSTFVILAAMFAANKLITEGIESALIASLLGVALFVSVFLHELGHAMAAKLYGIKTRSITLYPFGGIAAIENLPEDPTQEFWIAVAGPAVNFLIAGICTPLLLLHNEMLNMIIFWNVLMGVFNLLPAYPMDGGRVLRSMLQRKYNFIRSTEIAIAISSIFAWIFMVYGFTYKLYGLLIIGGLLAVMNYSEKNRLQQIKEQASK
jgi:Zn-dependent protease